MFAMDPKTGKVEAWLSGGCDPIFFVQSDSGPMLEPSIVYSIMDLLATFCSNSNEPSEDIVNLIPYLEKGPRTDTWVIRHDGDIQKAIDRVLVSQFPNKELMEKEVEYLRAYRPMNDNDQ